MADQFDTWRVLLRIAREYKTKPAMRGAIAAAGIQVLHDEPIRGYYRTRKGEAVAIFDHKGELVSMLGEDKVDLSRVWPEDCVFRPVPYGAWRDKVLLGKPWPDEHRSEPADEDEPALGHNEPPSELELWRDRLETIQREANQYQEITDDDAASRAQGFRSESVNKLRGEIDKTRDTLVRPHLEAQRKINADYMPLVKALEDIGKRIARALSAYETEKAYQRAMAPAPEAEAPTTAIKGAVGRAANVKDVELIIEVTDWTALFAYFRADADVQRLLKTKAQRVIDATGEIPPGIRTETRRRVA